MIKLTRTRANSDDTFNYDVSISENMTVKSFIEEYINEYHHNNRTEFYIINDKTWVENPSVEYMFGDITTNQFSDDILNTEIVKVFGNGGWGAMSFFITLPKKETEK